VCAKAYGSQLVRFIKKKVKFLISQLDVNKLIGYFREYLTKIETSEPNQKPTTSTAIPGKSSNSGGKVLESKA
jgi:hypothetical protein